MTNATIDSIDGTSFVVAYPAGKVTVKLAPDARVGRTADGSLADLTPRAMIKAAVIDGAAQQISIRQGM